jgi:hypothetical protein
VKRVIAAAAMALGLFVLGAAPAGAFTTSQLGANCRAQWAGSKTSKSFRSYRSHCIKAGRAAISAATDAGNPASKVGNRQRAVAACTAQYPVHATKALRKAYSACVRAVTVVQRKYGARPLRAVMKGASEVPKAGSASGRVSVRLNETARRVCFDLSISNLGFGTVTAANIRKGRKGRKGSSVVVLGDAISLDPLNHHDRVSACVNHVAKRAIRLILKTPSVYYVSVRTTLYPTGAARGQLKRTG